MADDLSTINKRRVYSDGTDTNSAATALPVMARQDLSTASALPTTNAQGIVQPAGPSAPTLGAAAPLAPVAAPAAAAAAAAPVTPNEPAGPTIIGDPNLHNRPPVGTPGGGASQIPGQTPQQAQQDAAFYAANPNLRPGQEPLISGDTLHTINSISGALPPQLGTPIRGAVAGVNALNRVLAGEKAAYVGKSSADIARDLGTSAPGAAAQAAKVAPTAADATAAVTKPGVWNNMSGAQKTMAVGAGLADAVIPAYQAGAPDPTLPPVPTAGANQNGYPNTAGAPLDTAGQPIPFTPPAADPNANLGQITRVGNSFSGTNVGAGTSPTPEEAAAAHQRNMQGYANESAYMQDKTARTMAQDEWNGQAPGMASFTDTGRTGGEAWDKFREEANLNNAKARTSFNPRAKDPFQSDDAGIKAAMAPIEARQKREALNQTANNDLAKTRLTTQAENARSAATNAITMRGQNITADTARGNTLATIYGADSKAGSEKNKLDFEAKKTDREFIRTAAKDGQEKAEKEWKARNDAQDEVTKRAASMRGPDDKAGASRDAAAVMSHIEDTKAQLEEVVKNNPNNKDAAEQLDKFKRFGARNLDDTQIHNLLKGIQLTEKVNAANTNDKSLLMRMWKGTQTGVTSNEPFAGVKRISRPNAPDIYVETDASGRPIGRDRKPLAAGSTDYGRVLPASVIEKDEGILGTGFFAKPSNDFRTLVRN